MSAPSVPICPACKKPRTEPSRFCSAIHTPTPPPPERTTTDVLVERARAEAKRESDGRWTSTDYLLLTALAERLAELAAENERLRAELEASRG